MADNTDNESITETVPKTLGVWLLDNVDQLEDFYPEFPSANRKIQTPSVSIHLATNDFSPLSVIYPCAPIPAPDGNNKALVKYAVGIYDFSLQVDIWAGSKEERRDIFDTMFNAMNPNISPMGLELVMEDYYNQLCSYLYTGHTIEDSEVGSQRDEWRLTMTVLSTCKAVREREEFIVTQPATQAEIESNVSPSGDKNEISSTVTVT